MSGGSYNYLCYKDSTEIGNSIEDLNSMATRLRGIGAIDLADKTASIRMDLELIQQKIESLQGIWHAVEWCDSHDSGPDGIDDAIAEYRKKYTNASR